MGTPETSSRNINGEDMVSRVFSLLLTVTMRSTFILYAINTLKSSLTSGTDGGKMEAMMRLLDIMARLRDPERGWFDFEDVARSIAGKLTARHPHVFAGAPAGTAAELSLQWERHKEHERRRTAEHAGVLDGIAATLPAMSRAVKLQKRAARVGFDGAESAPVLAKIREELGEVEQALNDAPGRMADEIGDLLFACINLARHAGVEPEQALRGANRRFERRFRYVEEKLRERGRALMDASLSEMDALWEEAKREERAGPA